MGRRKVGNFPYLHQESHLFGMVRTTCHYFSPVVMGPGRTDMGFLLESNPPTMKLSSSYFWCEAAWPGNVPCHTGTGNAWGSRFWKHHERWHVFSKLWFFHGFMLNLGRKNLNRWDSLDKSLFHHCYRHFMWICSCVSSSTIHISGTLNTSVLSGVSTWSSDGDRIFFQATRSKSPKFWR